LSCYIHRNPLRAGIVKRLIDYKWSSYPVYAYNRKYPEWLKTDTILSQLGTDNPQLGVDKSLIKMFLEMTPEERLKSNDNTIRVKGRPVSESSPIFQ